MPNAVVDALEAKRLIRPEARAGARWYELTHDRLIEPIQSSNQRYLAARRRRQTVAAAAVAVPLVAAAVAVPIALRPSNASTRSPFAASWALTPGVRYPSVTQGTVTRTICSLGW